MKPTRLLCCLLICFCSIALFSGEAMSKPKKKKAKPSVQKPAKPPVLKPAGPPIQAKGKVAWTMVVLPDTQNYVQYPENREIFNQITQWIKDNKEKRNIALVLHEGDIVNNSTPEQWTAAQAAMKTLDGVVPYILTLGNHDYQVAGDAQRRTPVNQYFPITANPPVDPKCGGIAKGFYKDGELQNAYYEFTAPDGRGFLICSLEFGPREKVVEWANEIAAKKEYADHTAILLTHAYLKGNAKRDNHVPYKHIAAKKKMPRGNPHTHLLKADTNDGEELWTKLVAPNPNFQLTFSGHFTDKPGAYLRSPRSGMSPVYQLFFNRQTDPNGGDGWIRLLEFMDDGKTVQVKTYSPKFDQYETDAVNQFFFPLSPAPPKVKDTAENTAEKKAA